jgi:hypothetical protein
MRGEDACGICAPRLRGAVWCVVLMSALSTARACWPVRGGAPRLSVFSTGVPRHFRPTHYCPRLPSGFRRRAARRRRWRRTRRRARRKTPPPRRRRCVAARRGRRRGGSACSYACRHVHSRCAVSVCVHSCDQAPPTPRPHGDDGLLEDVSLSEGGTPRGGAAHPQVGWRARTRHGSAEHTAARAPQHTAACGLPNAWPDAHTDAHARARPRRR